MDISLSFTSRARKKNRRLAAMACRIGLCLAALTSVDAFANVWIVIPDASQLYYQTAPDSRIYLRNLNSFNSSALGCCYNYYIDLTTEEGKALLAIMLTNAARGSQLWLSVPDGFAAGPVTYGGNWAN